MTKSRKAEVSGVIAGIATVAAFGGWAMAQQATPPNDALHALSLAKISLIEAITSAEAQTAGRATQAELEHESGRMLYEVETVTADGKVFDVMVDAADARVLSAKPDVADRDERDGGEERDDD